MQPTRRATLAFGVALLLPACGSQQRRPDDLAGLGRWEGEMQHLFDDQIHPAAVGVALDGQAPSEDRALPLRAQAADVVARMRVQTVTRPAVGAWMSYLITLQVGRPTLMPTKVEDHTFELKIVQHNPAFALIQSIEPQLRGKIFIGFVKRFAGADGPEIHFHLTADTPEVAQVIGELAMLKDLAGD